MADSYTRIAFVAKADTAYARQLTSGLSQFAKPSNGFILREFILGPDAVELPLSYTSWSPDAVVSYIASDQAQLLGQLSASGRPTVSASRIEPTPNRGVILGDANELFEAVHEHFRELGIRDVVQFVMGESLQKFGSREFYGRYAEARNIPFCSFTVPDPEELGNLDRMLRVEEHVAAWLRDLPRPVGIFSQSNFAGSYLCRCCELLGIQVPQEAAIIGTDGFDVARAARPPLTTIHVPGEAVGCAAGKLLASMLRGMPAPNEIVRISGASLIVRGSTRATARYDCNVDAAMDFIFRHACQGIRVNDVVSHTQGVSRMTFHKRFVGVFGVTPGEALKERQLSEARRFVSETELSFSAIAAMCGYCDYAHFYRAFCDAEGVGPRAYRQALLQTEEAPAEATRADRQLYKST